MNRENIIGRRSRIYFSVMEYEVKLITWELRVNRAVKPERKYRHRIKNGLYQATYFVSAFFNVPNISQKVLGSIMEVKYFR